MTDITEKQTMEYFLQGAKKAKSAARALGLIDQSNAWTRVRSQLAQFEKNAQKLFTSKPQTRTETLAMANKIVGESVH